MKITIPKQLLNNDFRFRPLKKGTKEFYKTSSQKDFKYDNAYFTELLNLGYNYGCVGGYGNLVIVDIDSNIILQEYNKLDLPATLRVLSALKNKPHDYYITENPEKTRNFNGLDIRGIGTYAVGCSCILNENNKLLTYKLNRDLPIAKLSNEQYNQIIKLGEKYPRQNKSKKHVSSTKYYNKPKKYYPKKPKPEFSYYFDKKDFEEKPTNFFIEDLIKMPGKRFEFIVTSEDGNYLNKTFDLEDMQMLKLLRLLLRNKIITLKSIRYYDEKRKGWFHKWRVLDVKNNDKNRVY